MLRTLKTLPLPLLLLACGAAFGKFGDGSDFDVVMVNVPAGDCFLLELPGAKQPITVIIDAGEAAGGYRLSRLLNWKQFNLVEAAKSRKQKVSIKPVVVDALIATHVHDDHMSGLTKLMNLGYVRPRAVYWNGYAPGPNDGSRKVYADFRAACSRLKLKPIALNVRKPLTLPVAQAVTVRVLNPDPACKLTGDWGQRTNNASVVLGISWRTPQGCRFDAIFCGDMYEQAQRRVLGSLCDPYDLVKLAHHGSAHQDSEFVRRTSGSIVFTTRGPSSYGTLWLQRGRSYFPTTTCLAWLGAAGLIRPAQPQCDAGWCRQASRTLAGRQIYCAADPALGGTDIHLTAGATATTVYHYPRGAYTQLASRRLRK